LRKFIRYKNLAAKYLSGNCNSAEQQQFERWLSLSDKHKHWFKGQTKAWELSKANTLSDSINVETALNKVNQRIAFMHQPQPHRNKAARKPVSVYSWVAGAAAVFLLGLAVLFFMKNETQPQMHVFAAIEKTETPLQLPDGSSVFLNSGSEIAYPEGFDSDIRQTTFKGEALFEVESNPEAPFQILTDHFGVEVLGTKFNLKAAQETDQYFVDLIEGKLRLFTFDQDPNSSIEQLILLPGERGIFDAATKRLFRAKQTDLNFMAWHSGILEFINTPLTDALETINAHYPVKFLLADKHHNLRITARFEKESSEQLIESLQTIFSFEVIRDGQTVYLR
jgi:ferric-dicitrate binding protein FerR (iron transport regulator)